MDEGAAYLGTMAPTAPVDLGRLGDWLRDRIDGFGELLAVEQFRGGQSNPTYKLLTPSGAFVLRRKPPGALLPSAHAVEREYQVLKALEGTGVPVARARALCEDLSVLGSVFYVMDFVDGRIFWDQRLPDLSAADRAAIFDSMNATIARIHQLDPVAIGLGEFGRGGNFTARQIARWTRQYRASETETIEAMDLLIEWLPSRAPAEAAISLVHGDFRLDNLIIHPVEPRVIAVLDWELSTVGDPAADFAYHAMSWRLAPDLFRGLAGIDLAALGIPDEAAYVQAYCGRLGQARVEHWEFYMVFSMFRIAAILQGVRKRALEGNASNAHADEVGRRARPVAEQAWVLARQTA